MNSIYLRLTMRETGLEGLFNAEAITCVVPSGNGSRIFLTTEQEDSVEVVESVDQIASLLDVRTPPSAEESPTVIVV